MTALYLLHHLFYRNQISLSAHVRIPRLFEIPKPSQYAFAVYRWCIGIAAKQDQTITSNAHVQRVTSNRFRSVRLKIDKSANYFTSLPPISNDPSNRRADTCRLTYMHCKRTSRPRTFFTFIYTYMYICMYMRVCMCVCIIYIFEIK